jgi:hypothetical protein
VLEYINFNEPMNRGSYVADEKLNLIDPPLFILIWAVKAVGFMGLRSRYINLPESPEYGTASLNAYGKLSFLRV